MPAGKLDMRKFPELQRMMAQRERQVNLVRARRALEHDSADGILTFWRELAERIEEEDELQNMEAILGEIHGDIDMLKSLKFTLEIQKEIEPEAAGQLMQVIRLIQLLLDLLDQFKKRHWLLRDRALAYWMSLNPAIPSKAKDKFEQDKDKKAKGQAKAQKALEETQKPKGKGKAGDKKKTKEQAREKKMSA